MARSALLDEALEAAGGLERWRAARRITARVRSGGLPPRTRMSVARAANGAHYCSEHRRFDGLVFPTRRRVLPRRRSLRSLPFPTIVSLELSGIGVEGTP